MLDACAKGWSVEEKPHNYCIKWGRRTYPSLPKGTHGKGNPDIHTSHVRKLARHFEIEECAEKQLPALNE